MVELASNPWVNWDSTLSQETPIADEIINVIADILEEWPGPPICTLTLRERHEMFILTIAGYPDIGQALRPLDHPLHLKAQRALKLSLDLDSIKGLDTSSSLRSDILDHDIAAGGFGEKIEDQWGNRLKDSLLILVLILFEENPELVKNHSGVIRLSGILFSLDNTGFDILSGLFGENGRLYALGSLGDARIVFRCQKDIEEIDNSLDSLWPYGANLQGLLGAEMKKVMDIDIDPVEIHNKKFSEDENPPELSKFCSWVELQREKNAVKLKPKMSELVRNLGLTRSVSRSRSNEGRLVFEFRFIQDWLENLYCNADKDKGTGQRYLRGGSSIIEASLSSLRQYVCERYGPGCIEIDGGGRIELRLPMHGSHDTDLLERDVKWMENRFRQALNLNEGDLSERFHDVLGNWQTQYDTDMDGKLFIPPQVEEARKEARKAQEARIVQNEEFMEAGLPPRSIYTVGDDFIDEGQCDSISSLNRRKESMAKKKIRAHSEKCPRCSLFVPSEDIDWTREQSWVTNPGKWVDEGIEICPFHSLLFNIGLSQRKRDSILSLPRDDEDATMRTGNTVTQIARLDGNSVGWIFTRPGLNQTPDSRRRRCFRYNAHWWISLARSFGSISAVDSVGAWVTGGDDVLLAQYGEGDHLEKMLIGVCGNLDQSLNREMAEDPDGPLCTVTIAHVKDGENIKHMLDSSAELEFQAKKAWKIAAGNWNRKMIDSTKIPSDSPDVQGAFVDSSIDPEVKHFVSIEVKPMFSTQYLDESDAIIVDDWPGEWSEEFENKVLAMATKKGGNWEFLVSSMEDETKYRNLSRSHVVYSDDGVDQLRILPPKGE